jgi:aarF domain-containing kinase
MRSVVVLGRLCFRRACSASPTLALRTHPHTRFINQLRHPHRWQGWSRAGKKAPFVGTVLLAATLTPGAFLEIAERNGEGPETGEKAMLEASRDEIRRKVSKNATGILRIKQSIYVFFSSYVYEPIATGFRFLHLVVIFLPVIVTVPALWVGRRKSEHDNERSGTLWWYDFLVWSMERAGPAFIKVGSYPLVLPSVS